LHAQRPAVLAPDAAHQYGTGGTGTVKARVQIR
jgi:hypothetical protein